MPRPLDAPLAGADASVFYWMSSVLLAIPTVARADLLPGRGHFSYEYRRLPGD